MPTPTEQYRAALESGDIPAALSLLTDDVVLRSPLTTRVRFEGKHEAEILLRVVLRELSDIRFQSDHGDDHTRYLVHTARAGGTPFEETTRVDLTPDGLIRGLTLSIRPLTGLTAVMAALAGPMAAALGKPRWMAVALTLGSRPLAAMTRLGDRHLVPLAAPRR
ncbi:hypothetical protein JOF53_003082 [Crossiella equi]|uniref:SnoaL-like domain-containing protein n=1 Tax=Crossiella equi TaxID=130796 RepID=A0ABS5ACB0_9PSEU|nr:nuclear transport factor 2 family protein [Crossiella equi]MBP2474210.1 hypothetical protein [Crossiella equi]